MAKNERAKALIQRQKEQRTAESWREIGKEKCAEKEQQKEFSLCKLLLPLPGISQRFYLKIKYRRKIYKANKQNMKWNNEKFTICSYVCCLTVYTLLVLLSQYCKRFENNKLNKFPFVR